MPSTRCRRSITAIPRCCSPSCKTSARPCKRSATASTSRRRWSTCCTGRYANGWCWRPTTCRRLRDATWQHRGRRRAGGGRDDRRQRAAHRSSGAQPHGPRLDPVRVGSRERDARAGPLARSRARARHRRRRETCGPLTLERRAHRDRDDRRRRAGLRRGRSAPVDRPNAVSARRRRPNTRPARQGSPTDSRRYPRRRSCRLPDNTRARPARAPGARSAR